MKALVIDDLRDNLMIFDRMLCSQGFADNTLIETPRILLDWLKLDPKKLEAYDVILMDIALPEMNGIKMI